MSVRNLGLYGRSASGIPEDFLNDWTVEAAKSVFEGYALQAVHTQLE
jgi:hypothetical protein